MLFAYYCTYFIVHGSIMVLFLGANKVLWVGHN